MTDHRLGLRIIIYALALIAIIVLADQWLDGSALNWVVGGLVVLANLGELLVWKRGANRARIKGPGPQD